MSNFWAPFLFGTSLFCFGSSVFANEMKSGDIPACLPFLERLQERCYGKKSLQGSAVYEGELRSGSATGSGIISFSDGERYEGEVVEGRPEGRGIRIRSSGGMLAAFNRGWRTELGSSFSLMVHTSSVYFGMEIAAARGNSHRLTGLTIKVTGYQIVL